MSNFFPPKKKFNKSILPASVLIQEWRDNVEGIRTCTSRSHTMRQGPPRWPPVTGPELWQCWAIYRWKGNHNRLPPRRPWSRPLVSASVLTSDRRPWGRYDGSSLCWWTVHGTASLEGRPKNGKRSQSVTDMHAQKIYQEPSKSNYMKTSSFLVAIQTYKKSALYT